MKPTKSPLWLRAIAPAPAAPTVAKKNMSVRIELPFAQSVESMAELLGKSPSGLLSELAEAAIQQLSDSLKEERPDLLVRDYETERRIREGYFDDEHHSEEVPAGGVMVPRWVTPQYARGQLELKAAQERAENPPALEESDQAEDSRIYRTLNGGGLS